MSLDGRSCQGDGILRLTAIGVEIDLDAIYEDTKLDVTRRLAAGERQAPAV